MHILLHVENPSLEKCLWIFDKSPKSSDLSGPLRQNTEWEYNCSKGHHRGVVERVLLSEAHPLLSFINKRFCYWVEHPRATWLWFRKGIMGRFKSSLTYWLGNQGWNCSHFWPKQLVTCYWESYFSWEYRSTKTRLNVLKNEEPGVKQVVVKYQFLWKL